MKKKSLKMMVCAVLVFAMLALAACGGKKSTMEDYVNSKEFQTELEAMKGQFEGQGIDINITGNGNKLIYTYKLDIENADGMAEQLEAGIEAQRSEFVNVANEVKKVVDVDNPVVVIEYIDVNGDEIYTVEIPAE